jgi:hypothetical protein
LLLRQITPTTSPELGFFLMTKPNYLQLLTVEQVQKLLFKPLLHSKPIRILHFKAAIRCGFFIAQKVVHLKKNKK